jgi:hypothetical protein
MDHLRSVLCTRACIGTHSCCCRTNSLELGTQRLWLPGNERKVWEVPFLHVCGQNADISSSSTFSYKDIAVRRLFSLNSSCIKESCHQVSVSSNSGLSHMCATNFFISLKRCFNMWLPKFTGCSIPFGLLLLLVPRLPLPPMNPC